MRLLLLGARVVLGIGDDMCIMKKVTTVHVGLVGRCNNGSCGHSAFSNGCSCRDGGRTNAKSGCTSSYSRYRSNSGSTDCGTAHNSAGMVDNFVFCTSEKVCCDSSNT
jgi:hypothetical protein